MLLAYVFSSFSFAVNIDVSTSQYNIPSSKLSANIDGELNDTIWQNALTISLDLVNSPWNNQASPVKTQAKMVENGHYLYISFIADDPNPENIIAALADRDSRWGDDLVGIKLDTANNRRLNYSFLVNPFGVQHDQIYNEMTGSSNDAWDGIWQSYGKLTATGYQVEMAIPFHILNFKPSTTEKTWAFELIRLYPRDANLRISHVPLDRNNACWLCQYPEIIGFDDAKTGKNITVTPAIVAIKNQNRDVYNNGDWQDDNNVAAGVDIRWGISSDTLVNLTVNPDFSTIESDAAQLSVNKNFSLFYDEKRDFFLENSDYFTSNFDLVYTRNIADPDYGAKITGSKNSHTYGYFITNDTQTNFILPGNISSGIHSIDEESHSSALKYRYDFTDDFSVGFINTARVSDSYHNIVTGIDSKFRFDDSNSVLAQVVHANTQMPSTSTTDDSAVNDSAVKVELLHQSELWKLSAKHQQIGKNFRADLGFMPKADYQQESILIKRTFYADDDTSWWSDANICLNGNIDHDEAGNLLEKKLLSSAGIHGPMLSYVEFKVSQADKKGLQDDYFTEKQAEVYVFAQPFTNLYGEGSYTQGDKVDYINNRLGDFQEIWGHILVNLTTHLEVDLEYTYSELDVANNNVYQEQVANMRVSYQFDVRSYLKLNLSYVDIDLSESLNSNLLFSENSYSAKNKYLSSQLIYSYKINPQTLFFLGYSDSRLQDDYLKTFKQEERSFFTKISYAWMPN